MLREEFLIPMGLSANALAIAIGVPATRIGEIVNERRGISGDTALRLAKFFRMSPEFWMNMQTGYELENARFLMNPQTLRSIRPAPIDKKTGALKATKAA
jgi:addiction module HigA family antidote